MWAILEDISDMVMVKGQVKVKSQKTAWLAIQTQISIENILSWKTLL